MTSAPDPDAPGERTPAEPDAVRVRLDLAYDGGAFHGWARQRGQRTVQGVLEDALAELLARAGDGPRLTVAGRTDVGVHATGQVAHLDLGPAQLAILERAPARADPTASGVPSLPHRLAGVLRASDDVRVRGARVAPPGFDARFSAVWRRYEYRIADRVAERDPRTRGFTLQHPTELDAGAMDAAARSLLGLHDFAAYCKPREGATTIRTLQEFSWRRDADGVLVATVRADAFCHNMVRNLVGACVAVGEGRLEVADPAGLRAIGERTSAIPVLPARGLTLVEVGYPADGELAARAAQTRARRESLTDPARSE